jgi:N-acetylglucosaminyldiphosphoundecaprenol N-acetyl-beta-D-mannosaminyltransferase
MEKFKYVNRIRKGRPDFVLVSLGCPKQELWMHEHKDLLDSCLIGVGAAFDTFALKKKIAPQHLRRVGLEWLYRLCQEPRRLASRYLLGNTYFAYFFLKLITKRLMHNAHLSRTK